MRLLIALILAVPCLAVTTVSIARPSTAKAGVADSITLTATVTGPAGTIAWTHVSGPGTATFGTPTAAPSTTYTAPTRSTTTADYVVRACYTNSDGVTCAPDTHVGAVLVDSNDVVITGADPRIDLLLGPLLRAYAPTAMGSYFDIADAALGRAIATAALADPPHFGTQLTGTFQYINTGSPGSGGSGLIGTGSNLTAECNPACNVIVAWNSIDGAGTGRHWDGCYYVDNTHCYFSDYATYFTLGSGLSVYLQDPDSAHYQSTWWMNGSGNGLMWDYYGVELALYRLFYRTGILSYLTQARQMTDYLWQWQIDHGTKGEQPRVTNLQGQFLRALDGHSDRLASLYTYALYFYNGGANIQMPHDLRGTGFDAREAAYVLWGLALGAQADSGASNHTGYCAAVAALVPLWNTWQQPHGFWSEDLFGFNGGGYAYYPPGSSPWRTDIAIHALQAAYDVLLDTSASGCSNTALAATTLATIERAVNWAYNTGRAMPAQGGNGGVYYEAEYESLGEIANATSGTMSVNLTTTAVTGIGTNFCTDFIGDGSRYVGFLTTLTVYRVTACADSTHMTISPAFGYWSEVAHLSGSAAVQSVRSYPCRNLSGVLCGDIDNGLRDLTRLMPGMTGWAYNRTAKPEYRAMGDAWFINFAGGPADGPGGSLPCNGTGCDGAITDWEFALPSCDVSAPPCTNGHNGGSNIYSYLGKNYGQGPGNPGAANYLAWRVMTPLSTDRTLVTGSVVIRGKVSH